MQEAKKGNSSTNFSHNNNNIVNEPTASLLSHDCIGVIAAANNDEGQNNPVSSPVWNKAAYNWFSTPPAAYNAIINSTYWINGLSCDDTFNLLASLFGFQRDNVINQQEHVLMLLSNLTISYNDNSSTAGNQRRLAPIDNLHERIFANYKHWTAYLRTQPILPGGKGAQLALFFLIWGEAANVRFMPECLCYLYHRAAQKLAYVLQPYENNSSSSLSVEAFSEHFLPRKAYLETIIRPLYLEIQQMKTASEDSSLDHQEVRNYDDLNEFYWSRQCLKLSQEEVVKLLRMVEPQKLKTFYEKRSLWNPFLGFFRIYFFLLVMFHALVATAYVAYRGNPGGGDDSSGLSIYSNFFAEDTADLRMNSFCSIQLTFSALSVIKVLLELWIDGYMLFEHKSVATAALIRLNWHFIFFTLSLIAFLSPFDTILGMTYLSLAPVIFGLYFFPVLLAGVANSCASAKLRSSVLGPYLRGGHQEYLRRRYEKNFSVYARYASFWIVVFVAKFIFNLQLMIIPLIGPSVEIWDIGRNSDNDNGLRGPLESDHNILLLAAIWAPVFLVYMYDTQIWYTILQALVGVFRGIRLRVGQSSRVRTFINKLSVAPELFDNAVVSRQAQATPVMENETPRAKRLLRFAVVWNECISSFRLSDLVDDREASILQYVIEDTGEVCEPVFLLAGKIAEATDVASKFTSSSTTTTKLINALESKNLLRNVAVVFNLTRQIFNELFEAPELLQVLNYIEANSSRSFTKIMHVQKLHELREHLIEVLASLLDLPTPVLANQSSDDGKTILLHEYEDIAIFTSHVRTLFSTFIACIKDPFAKELLSESTLGGFTGNSAAELTRQRLQIGKFYASSKAVNSSTRLFLLLTLDVADAMPRCTEAQRRISFFLHSLNMKMPKVSSIPAMPSFSVVTPYYNETVMYSLEELQAPVSCNPAFKDVEDDSRKELTILKYLATCHPDEWGNFLERTGATDMESVLENHPTLVRLWASNRGQTLARTVQGMMMYEDALKMLHWLEIGSEQQMTHEDKINQIDAVVKMKFSYVTSCQVYGKQASVHDTRAADIDFLLRKYPNWRVSFVDEVVTNDAVTYDTVLLKSNPQTGDIEVVYRYELPGDPIVGEGKPENQNIAIPYSRGEYLQTIDMNQSHYFEETLKMPNFLATATSDLSRGPVTIIGMKEHIFTARASSLARFMTLQELVFVSLTQRVLANPLEARMHYGHPDVFDKTFVMIHGSVSKASKGINLSEDVFAGFNVTLRGGRVTHEEFILCGKGRDVALSQINQFEAKLATGSAESALSREGHRMGTYLDFFRLNSVYYGHMGFYISNLITVLCVFVYAYSKVYVALHSVLEVSLISVTSNLSQLSAVLNTQFIFQFGLLMTIPLLATLLTENSLKVGSAKFIELIVTLGPIFYVFETGTKAHYFDQAILRGGSKYRGTGRGFIVTREMFVSFFKEYAASHYRKAIELIALMFIFGIYGNFSVGSNALSDFCEENNDCEDTSSLVIPANITLLETYGSQGQAFGVASFAVWFLGVTWILAPFFFNTDGLDFKKSKADVLNWLSWMFNKSDGEDSWKRWWVTDMKERRMDNTFSTQSVIVIRELRHFFVMIYIFLIDFAWSEFYILGIGLGLLWIVLFITSVVGRTRSSCSLLIKALGFLAVVVLLFTAWIVLAIVLGGSIDDELSSNKASTSLVIAVCAGGYGLLQIALAFKSSFDSKVVQQLAFFYDFLFGTFITIPLLLLSAAPFMSIIQTRMMYNGGFSRALSTTGEFAASVTAATGLLGGFSAGWLTVTIFSLGFVNQPSDFFQNTSFVHYLNTVIEDDSTFKKDSISLYAGLASIAGVLLAAVVLKIAGRRVSMLLACVMSIAGVILLCMLDNITLILVGICITAGGVAMLSLSILFYNYEITTVEWRGKGINFFLLGSSIGFLSEASLLYTLNKNSLESNWTNNPTQEWRYQFIYGLISLVPLLPTIFWLPASPTWLLIAKGEKAAEAALVRLRRKHDVVEDLDELVVTRRRQRRGSPMKTIFPRVALISLMQAALAVLTSNVLLKRYVIYNGGESVGGGASRWQVYYGLMTFLGLLIGMFTVDQIRRKTILKDILPLAISVSILVGVLDITTDSTAASSIVESFLFLLYFVSALSLGTATWLSAFEMFPPSMHSAVVTFSFVLYYAVQTFMFVLTPSFALSQFLYAVLCMAIVLAMFFGCASTKTGAIRLKHEKKLEREQEAQMLGQERLSRNSRSRTHLRAFSARRSGHSQDGGNGSRSRPGSFLTNSFVAGTAATDNSGATGSIGPNSVILSPGNVEAGEYRKHTTPRFIH